MCNNEHSIWIAEIFKSGLIPFFVGAVSYLLFRGLDEIKKRKTYSTLGAIIIDCLLEELNTGIDIIDHTMNTKVPYGSPNMPFKSWTGINTLPDDVLLRIIRVSIGVKPTGSFHPKDIRKHTKNYFDHMCISWNNALQAGFNQQKMASMFAVYPEAAKGVKVMLEQTKELLEINAKKCYPK